MTLQIENHKETELRQAVSQLRQHFNYLQTLLDDLERKVHPSELAASSLDRLDLPEAANRLYNLVSRRGSLSLQELTQLSGQDEQETAYNLRYMAERGLLVEQVQSNQFYYALAGLNRRASQLPADLWDLLESRLEK
jgi:predicted HTH transcriptional regulator